MPSSSRKQKIAMQLAAAGKSKLGIPKSVGKEYVKADKAKCKASNPCKPKQKSSMSRRLAAAMTRDERENNMEG